MTTNPFLPSTSGLQPNAGLLGTPGAIVASSTTTQSIGTGSLTFTIEPQCAFAPGMWVSITDSSDITNWMWGNVSSYDGISQLIVDVTQSNGAGQYSTWLIALAGAPGASGTAGSDGSGGATGPTAGPVIPSSFGLSIKNNSGTPNTKISVTTLQSMLVNSSAVSVQASAVSITIDLTTGTGTSAANGMDGEARGTSAWIYLYLISNGSVTAGLGTLTSPKSGAPTMPSGYSYSQYIGAMRVDSSGNLLRTIQLGSRAQYAVTAATNTAALPAMITGSSGSISSPTWTSQSVSAFVPPTAGRIYGAIFYGASASGGVMLAPNNAYGVIDSTTNPPPVALEISSDNGVTPFDLLLESTNVYYASSTADVGAVCYGWEDYCVAA